MKKNKLILFDWGNIVESHTTGYNLYTAYTKVANSLGYHGKIPFTRLLSKKGWSSISTMEDFEKMFWDLKKEYNLKGEFSDFLTMLDEYFEDVEFYQDVRDYEISLRDQCYIGILSNLSITEKKRLDKQVGLDNYDYSFLSFELGCKKPEDAIYEYIEQHVPFKPCDILFIDDKKDNVKKAKKHGWNAVQTTGLHLKKIKKVCEKFLAK